MTPPALILAPHGRDATVACGLLADSGIPSIVCDDIADFENQLGEGISFAIVTEEALLPSRGRLADHAKDAAGRVGRLLGALRRHRRGHGRAGGIGADHLDARHVGPRWRWS